MKLIKGNIIFTSTKEAFEIYEDAYLLVHKGTIQAVGHDLDQAYPEVALEDYTGHLILPSFSDLHSHAVQYGNLGMGFDKPLLEWLESYTFPEENRFSDLAYAKNVFALVLRDIIDQGTTRIAFYSSIHVEATKLLMTMCHEAGIHAYVGKVCMDRNSPGYLTETKDAALSGTSEILSQAYPSVKGIITPRFVPTCTSALLEGLGEFSKTGHGVQTHLSENLDEIQWVKDLHPGAKHYLDVYDQHGLVGPQTILGHCIYCTEDEVALIQKRQAFVAHCPSANFNLTSGLMPVRKYLEAGIHMGLGTDVGAGHNLSIKTAMIQSIQMSKAFEIQEPSAKALSLSEAFYLATKGGGAFFGKEGSLEVGYGADFLIVKPSSIEAYKKISPSEALEKFIYSGSRSDIVAVYGQGQKIKG